MFKWFRRNKGETGAPASAPESVSEQTLADAKAAEPHREVEAEPRQDIEAQPRQEVEAQPRQEVEAQPHPESETQPLPERGAQAPAAYGLPLSAPEPETPAVVVQPQLLASAAPATVVPPAAVLVSAPEPIAPPVVVAPELETQPQSLPAAENSDARPRSLRERLAASTRALTQGIGKLFKRNPKLDEALLEELETALIQADMGVNTAMALVEQLRTRMRKREFADADGMFQALRRALQALIEPHAKPLQIPAGIRPFVILTVGVNGAGKTTTIGKLAQRYKRAGHSVMLAAGDTFRAAAVEQLKTWGERNQVAVVAQGSGADSASVIFDAFQAAKARSVDVLIADTAGRLHTQGHLMQELAKVKRVLGKIDPTAPHETLLVIDGGTGQNALNQAQQFHQAVGLTGVVITKLDGTAKGGMVFALCRELALPIRFIGVGEQREDLREFVASEFVNALLPEHLG